MGDVKQNTPSDSEKKGVKRLSWAPREFVGYSRTMRSTTRDLAIAIREQFALTFHDIIGCYIAFNDGDFDVTLYFENNADPNIPEGKIKNLEKIVYNDSEKGKTNFYTGMQVIQNRINGKAFKFTDETLELLTPFIKRKFITVEKDGTEAIANIDAVVRERRERANNLYYQNNSERIIMQISHLDLRKLCRELYGKNMVISTTVEDNQVTNKTSLAFYDVKLAKFNARDGVPIVNIEQFSPDEVDKINKAENPQIANNLGFEMY